MRFLKTTNLSSKLIIFPWMMFSNMQPLPARQMWIIFQVAYVQHITYAQSFRCSTNHRAPRLPQSHAVLQVPHLLSPVCILNKELIRENLLLFHNALITLSTFKFKSASEDESEIYFGFTMVDDIFHTYSKKL